MSRTRQRSSLRAALSLLAALWAQSAGAQTFGIGYGGRLAGADGAPVVGPVDLSVGFFSAATGGAPLGSGPLSLAATPLVDGVFQVTLAVPAADVSVLFADPAQPVWIEVTDATNHKVYPRQRFATVPYALRVPVDGATVKFDATGALTAPAPAPPPDGTTKTYVDTLFAGAVKANQDITNVGNLSMTGSKTLGLSVATSDPAGLGAADVGRIWYNGGIRLWNGTSAQSLGISGAGVLSLNGLNNNVQGFANGTGGAAPAWVSAGATHTLNLPLANAGGVSQGLISNAEWTLFNGKQNVLPAANGVTNGYLNGGDWTVFNAKQPLLPPGSLTANGYLASADWAAFNAKQNALGAANGGGAGYLTAGDWSAFNGREPAVTAGSTVQYYRGDKTWQTLATGAVVETSNLYYTTVRAQADARSAVGVSAPLQYNAGTGAVSLPPATLTANGYLASSDWATFNAKSNALPPASASTPGFLASSDWALFNGKQSVLPKADGATNGYLAAADWTLFNGKQPLLAQGALSTNGFLASADWATFNGKDPYLAPGSAAQYYGGNKTWQNFPTAAVSATGYLASGDWGLFNSKAAPLGFTPVNRAGDAMSGALSLPANAFNVGTTQLAVMNNFVGIGTSNPTYPLDVYQTGASGELTRVIGLANNPVYSGIGNTGSNLSLGVGGSLAGSAMTSQLPYAGFIAEASNYPFQIGTNNTARVTIDATGRMGVGTTNPTQQLSVNGTVESTSGGFKYPDTTTQTTGGYRKVRIASGQVNAVSTWSVSSLAGDTDKTYDIELTGYVATTTNCTIYMQPNGDATAANYTLNEHRLDNVGSNIVRYNGTAVGMPIVRTDGNANVTINSEVKFFAARGTAIGYGTNTLQRSSISTNTDYPSANLVRFGSSWMDTANQVTSITFKLGTDVENGGTCTTGTFTGEYRIYADRQ